MSLNSRLQAFLTPRGVMEKFVRLLNIERFRRLLQDNPTDAQRDVVERLLAEEEAKAKPESPPAPEAPES